MLGHEVTVFDAKPKLGGLNEYGLATYKTVDGFAQKEIDWLLSIGGIDVRRPASGSAATSRSESLVRDFDAVFLGLGLAGVNALGLPSRAMPRLARRGRLHRRAAPGGDSGRGAGRPPRAWSSAAA